MPLREDFERSGNWLFRWRSFLPVIVLAGFALILKEFTLLGNSERLDQWWEVFCLGVSFFGLTIRILTIGHTPYGTSGRNTHTQVAETLNTTGLYSAVRNPLYLGNYFMSLGIVLFLHLWWLVVIYTLIFWLYYERIIFAEEEFLRSKFGQSYLDWANTTPVFIPSFAQYKSPELCFSLKNVLRREYNGFFAVILIMFILEVVGDIVVEGRVHFDQGWLLLLAVGFTVWATLRFLKKHTTVLDVDGR